MLDYKGALTDHQNKLLLRQKDINSIFKRSIIFSDFPPSDIVRNVGPKFSSFRPLLSYSFVATAVVNNFCG